ncbi:MAG TPA: hypothetical protein VM144_11730 [Aestuariivirga sp.]|nr:hypothetical protein [Aestuariivirga sp.]
MSFRKKANREKILKLVTELEPFFRGEVEFNPFLPPAVSSAAIEALITIDAMNVCKKLFERNASSVLNAVPTDKENKANEDDSEAQILLLSKYSVAIESFFEAIENGQNHPIFDFWTAKRKGKTSRRAIERAQSEAALLVSLLLKTRHPGRPTRKKALEIVADILDKNGFYKNCKASTIDSWTKKFNFETRGVDDEDMKAAMSMLKECGYDKDKIIVEFVEMLKDWRPVFTDTRAP